jgi:hypothetical protein|tara:strand:+ start:850 stop:1545 length:696 start_codon:yes stop_codon:yes gene_type:complete
LINVGLIGYGNWGRVIHSKLKSVSNVKFICRSNDTYEDKLDLVDWVFVVTPDDTHYDIVKTCILNGKNIFCEKPFTANFKQAMSLYGLAKTHGVKLYVDDVFNFRNELKELHDSIDRDREIKVVWNTLKSKNYLNRLVYHNLYMLYPILNSEVNVQWPKINNITFEYGVVDKKYHEVNGIDFTHSSGNNDALFDMINGVLHDNNNVDWDYNKQITLNSEKILERIKRNIND